MQTGKNLHTKLTVITSKVKNFTTSTKFHSLHICNHNKNGIIPQKEKSGN